MKPKKLYIGIPAYDSRLMATTMVTLMTFLNMGSPLLAEPPHIDFGLGESHVNRARNRLIHRFLKSPCTHFLGIDSDIGFDPTHITRLLERDYPMVCGLYAKKLTGEPQWVLNTFEDEVHPDETGLTIVKYAGTGFVLIAREVFEAMIIENERRQARNQVLLSKLEGIIEKEDFDYLTRLSQQDRMEYEDDGPNGCGRMHNFFHSGVRNDKWLSEDWWFSDEWNRLGGKIYCDTRCQTVHVGYVNYPIR